MSESKRKILEGALQCFMSKGVEETTIADIRDTSGVSVGSIYHHFGNKEAIVVSLFMTGMEDHAVLQEQALAAVSSAEEGVKAIVRCYINWIHRHPEWARFVFRYRSLVENSALASQHEEQKRAHFRRLKAWLNEHVQSGEIKSLPIEIYHSLVIGPSQDFAIRWLRGSTKTDLVDYRELYAEAAWHSVRA